MTEAILLILFALTIAATLYMGHKIDTEETNHD